MDQYAWAVTPGEDAAFNKIPTAVSEKPGSVKELARWRKHADLQGWMEKLYVEKCESHGVEPRRGEEDSWLEGEVNFNCIPLLLTGNDLDELEVAVCEKSMPHTTGFFFGSSHPEHDYSTLEFIREAREAIAADMLVYYDSWW